MLGMKIKNRNIFFTIFLFGLMAVPYVNQAHAEQRWDLLTIESIKCVKPAGGIDGALLDVFKYIEDIGGYVKDANVPAVSDIAGAAAKGSSKANKALKYLDGKFSGQDDLIVRINGKQYLPETGTYQAMNAGQEINPNIQVSFTGKVRISLIEWDSGSDNDDLGNATIDSSGMKNNDVRQWKQLIVKAPAAEDGSIYYITARVDAGKGNPNSMAHWVKCGTGVCRECSQPKCAEHKRDGLDRDGDKSDLKSCPPGYKHYSYQKYPQTSPAEDVYLRICMLDNVRLIGIGMSNGLFIRNSLTSEWRVIPDSGRVIDVATMPDGKLVGVGMSNGLFVRDSLTSGWRPIPDSGNVIAITVMPDGKIIGVGMSNGLFVRDNLTSGWRAIPNSGRVIDVAAMPDGKLVGVGMSNGLFVRDSLTNGWRPIPDSGNVIAITTTPDGKIIGVGMSHGLFIRDTLNSGWRPIPNSGNVIAITSR